MTIQRLSFMLMGFLAGIAFIASCGGGGGPGPGDALASERTPIPVDITQTDLPPGSTFTLGGATYTIVQFEIPNFDTDEVYLVRFPSFSSYAPGQYGSDGISVIGSYPDDSNDRYGRFITTLSGYDVTFYEGFNASSRLYNNDEGLTATSAFYQGLSAQIHLGLHTAVSLQLYVPYASVSETRADRTPDSSGFVGTYPPVLVTSERAAVRETLRQLLGYVSVSEKV